MGRYSQLVAAASQSVHYWAQAAMRNFVRDLGERMDASEIKKSDLAAVLEVSPAYVTKVMRGDANFTLETMTKLAMAVGGRLDVRIVDSEAATAANGWATSRAAAPFRTEFLNFVDLTATDIAANETEWEFDKVRVA